MAKRGKKTMDEFLDEQEARWSPATFSKYEIVVGLLKSYWPGHDGEQEGVRKAGGTFCGTYGPEDIAANVSMFLDYFMPNKVVGSEGTFKAAPRVIKKLAKWLVAKGYDPDADYAAGEPRPRLLEGGRTCEATRRNG